MSTVFVDLHVPQLTIKFYYLFFPAFINIISTSIYEYYACNNLTLQASATVIPYWYLADMDLGIVWGILIVGWIFCKHIITAFINVSWAILVIEVSCSENPLNK